MGAVTQVTYRSQRPHAQTHGGRLALAGARALLSCLVSMQESRLLLTMSLRDVSGRHVAGRHVGLLNDIVMAPRTTAFSSAVEIIEFIHCGGAFC